MAGRSLSTVVVLGFLLVATFCGVQAQSGVSVDLSPDVNLDVNLEALIKLSICNKLKDIDVKVVLKTGEVLFIKAGAVGVLGPLKVKLQALDVLRVKLFLFGKDGTLLAVKAEVDLDLKVVAKVVAGVKEVVGDLLEELIGEDCKLIKLVDDVDAKVVAVIELPGKGPGAGEGLVDVDALVKVSLNNLLKDIDVKLALKAGKVLDVKAGAVGVLGPLTVKVQALDVLRVKLFLLGKDGKVLAVKAKLDLDLKVLAKVVVGVKELVINVVQELVGKDCLLIKLIVDAKVVAVVDLGKHH